MLRIALVHVYQRYIYDGAYLWRTYGLWIRTVHCFLSQSLIPECLLTHPSINQPVTLGFFFLQYHVLFSAFPPWSHARVQASLLMR